MLAAFTASLWIVCTVTASAAQTARNVMQRDLIVALGTAGATHVRFLFSLPFIALLFALETLVLRMEVPAVRWTTLAWIASGAGSQALATGLMLAGMKARSFVVVTAFTKVEPVVIAIFGVAFLGETPRAAVAAAIVIATAGVLLMSWPKRGAQGIEAGWRPAALGLGGGALFALSATSYRGALLDMGEASVAMKSTTALVIGLSIQCSMILAWLAAFDRPTLKAIRRDWRKSLFAGFMGAFASQLWLMAFALASAAAVRTLALLEVPMAQVVTRRLFKQGASLREYAGMALIVGGIALLLNG
ncbi:MAG: Multidrug transporter permease [Hyphomicrobiales bacterium]|nr:Multidrug transporter permease [Hyphomicrobiales bacterium]